MKECSLCSRALGGNDNGYRIYRGGLVIVFCAVCEAKHNVKALREQMDGKRKPEKKRKTKETEDIQIEGQLCLLE